MVVAPHHLAAEAGARVLREGGNAVEAMIAAASTIAVVYPHMNALGGDNFWLIHQPGSDPAGIDACGGAAALATPEYYREQGMAAIPGRGPHAALTVAGVVAGWQKAFEFSRTLGGRLPLARLLEDAIHHAATGVPATETLATNIAGKLAELRDQPGFSDSYLVDGKPLQVGQLHRQPRIAATLLHLARSGLDDFYRGELAEAIATDLEQAGSPLRLDDLQRYAALQLEPLSLQMHGNTLYNMPPPTQGLASLMLLGIHARLNIESVDDYAYVHSLVEATKQAFKVRDREVSDPEYMRRPAGEFLSATHLDELATGVQMDRAAPWPDASVGGDTVWLGAVDSEGRAVSFIQSIYWEFGSGVVLPQSGITWQNRGTSFSLDAAHHNCLKPGRRPFHTIQPALAHLADGRVMPYGTMGGEGQPQTQAMVYTRYVNAGYDLQQSITAPRWLLGRTWGSDVTNLRIENRFDSSLFDQLRSAGHDLEVVGEFDEVMGHAGAIVLHKDGLIEGASDPRCDGAACGV
jgi:gamma-glutamyltranspeptidase/glutathione hydrolase